MIAAIYARKSNDQSMVVDEAKSVTRQIEHARQFAERKGWTVENRYIFVDDGISGAEFASRPGNAVVMTDWGRHVSRHNATGSHLGPIVSGIREGTRGPRFAKPNSTDATSRSGNHSGRLATRRRWYH